MKVRRRARSIVLQSLYEWDLARHDASTVAERLLSQDSLPADGAEFARSLVRGVVEHRDELDAVLKGIAPEWPIHQIAAVDRNILRMAIYEIRFEPDIPFKVSINEAVELAKRFGSESSRRFVNGALGSLTSKEKAEAR